MRKGIKTSKKSKKVSKKGSGIYLSGKEPRRYENYFIFK